MACIAPPVSGPPHAENKDAESGGSAHGATLPPPPPPFPPPPTALPSAADAMAPGGACGVHVAESSGDFQHSLSGLCHAGSMDAGSGDQAVGAGCPATEYGGASAAGPPAPQLASKKESVKEAALGGAAGASRLAEGAEYGHGGGGQRSSVQSVSNTRKMPYNDACRLDVVLEGACRQNLKPTHCETQPGLGNLNPKPRPETLNPNQGRASLKTAT